MSNRYRVLLPLTVHTDGGAYTQGQEFEKEFTVTDEAENLDSGLLELVPNEYKVTGGSTVHGAAPGETFTAPLRLGEEALLVAGGHIKRVEKPAPAPTTRKSKEANK